MKPKRDILIVDDDVATTQFIIEALHDEGYAARGVHNGLDAIAALDSARPDLVLIDLRMPGMSGEQLLDYFRTHGWQDVPVIIMTADSRASRALSERGLDNCLLKPFTLDDLLDCVARHIGANGNSSSSAAA